MLLLSSFSKNYFRNTIRVSKGLDPDQERYFVRPDLGPSCLQRLSAVDSWQFRYSEAAEVMFSLAKCDC